MVSLTVVSVTGCEARYLTRIVSCGSSLLTSNGASLLLVPDGGRSGSGYRVFPGGKVRPGRDADPSPLLVPRSKIE